MTSATFVPFASIAALLYPVQAMPIIAKKTLSTDPKAVWARERRAARGLKRRGRKAVNICPTCSGTKFRRTGSGKNKKDVCVICCPARPTAGRPRTRNV